MGDIADMMLDGTLCQGCGVYLENGNGFPGYCGSCARELGPAASQDLFEIKAAEKVTCKKCGKRVKANGLRDHQRDKHGIT